MVQIGFGVLCRCLNPFFAPELPSSFRQIFALCILALVVTYSGCITRITACAALSKAVLIMAASP